MRREIPFLSDRVWQALLIGGSVFLSVFLGFVLAQQEPFPMETIRNELPTVTPVAIASEPLVFVTPTPAVAAVIATPQSTTAAEVTTNVTINVTEPTVSATEVTASPVPPNVACTAAPADWLLYEVQPDDDVTSLSIRSGATVAEIVQANCLEAQILVVGMVIRLPGTPPTRVPCGAPPLSWRPYTVRAGDTLFSLARTRGVTIYAIQQANCFSGNRIVAGGSLYLPPVAVIAPTVAIPSATPTIRPSNTPVPPTVRPSNTPVPPTVRPSNTPVPPTIAPTLEPIETSIPRPSLTPTTLPPRPTDTPAPTVTNTPIPTSTSVPPTHTPVPTNTPVIPTSTPIPTNTPVPPTNTPVPPTNTPIPTNTPVPPTNTPIPPTSTPIPPTNTPEPTSTPEPTLDPSPTPII